MHCLSAGSLPQHRQRHVTWVVISEFTMRYKPGSRSVERAANTLRVAGRIRHRRWIGICIPAFTYLGLEQTNMLSDQTRCAGKTTMVYTSSSEPFTNVDEVRAKAR